MENEIKKSAQMLGILSNEVRLCILVNLNTNGEKKVGELQHCTKASQSFVSQQLSKLKSMNIISYRKVGNEVFYSLTDDNIKEVINKLGLSDDKDK